MDKKISVIVPIYNVEKYLRQCIDSIINQTYKNLEIILVNDGSPDNCGQICDEYSKYDERIIVIHKKNGGLSDARNAGLDASTGEYISFIDSDDWIDTNMFEIMMNLMEINKADISECGVKYIYDNDNSYEDENTNISIFNREESLNQLVLDNIRQTVWNKLYKKRIIENIQFKVGKSNEDEFWTYRVLDRINTIVKTEEKLYYYYQREGSIVNSIYSIKKLDGLEARYERLKFLDKYPDIQKIAARQIVFDSLYHYQNCLKYLDYNEGKNAKEYIKKQFKKIHINNIDFNKYELKEKIWFLFSKVSIDMAAKTRNFFSIGI